MSVVDSRVYPKLERVPGVQNWVDRAGGLPDYIERIAKHLHYEKGFSISRAIATAVNTVKRWARMGKVAKHGDPNHKHVTAKTAALAAAAVAEWEAKRAAGKVNLTEAEFALIDLTYIDDEYALLLAEDLLDDEGQVLDLADDTPANTRTGAGNIGHDMLRPMNVQELAQRANQIEDPALRATAREAVLALAAPRVRVTSRRDLSLTELAMEGIVDLASTIAPRNAHGRAKDGRRSYKGQGKYKHGFIPVDTAAKEAKAKGSPIAIKRLNRLYGTSSDQPRAKIPGQKPYTMAARGRAGQRTAPGKINPKKVRIDEKTFPGSEGADTLGHLQRSPFDAATNKNRVAGGNKSPLPKGQKEASKSSRVPHRARQNWDEIPDNVKTVRNGKRYVLAEFGGKGYVTPWLGGVQGVSGASLNKRIVYRTLSPATAAKMTTAQLRDIINNPRTSPAAKAQARRTIKSKGAQK